MDLPVWLIQAIDTFGYAVVFLAIAIESTGIPFPGETALIGAAIYAGTGRGLNIVLVIACCAAGAIVGDNMGYAVGRYGGYPLLRKLLRVLHLKETTLGVTQRYFEQHGDKTVFIGRFFAILRCWAAFLAGVNQMPWRSFLFWNAAGGIIWATIFGTLGSARGNNLPMLGRVLKALGIAGTVVATAVIGGLLIAWFVHHRRAEARAVAKVAGTQPVTAGPVVRRRVTAPR